MALGLSTFGAHEQQRGSAVVDLAAVARGDVPADLREPLGVGGIIEGGTQPGQDLGRGRRADALVPGDNPRRPVVAGHGYGYHLGVEQARFLGRSGTVVTGGGELVEFGPAETPLSRDQLGADALGNEAVRIAPTHAHAERVGAGRHVGSHGHPAHALDTAGDHDVVDAGHDALRGEVDGLLRGAALTVDGGGRDGFREARGEDGPAGGVDGLLTDLIHAAAHHVVDERGVEGGSFGQGSQRMREEVDRMDR